MSKGTPTHMALVGLIVIASGMALGSHLVNAEVDCVPAPEICNGLDDDCDGVIPADEVDADGDGYFPICGASGGPWDCDDSDPATHDFAPELCDGKDNDCDGLQTGEDEDGDGYLACGDFNANTFDCDDHNPDVYPHAPAICDGTTNNCICLPWICGIRPGCDCDWEPDWDWDHDGFSPCEGDCADWDERNFPNVTSSISPSTVNLTGSGTSFKVGVGLDRVCAYGSGSWHPAGGEMVGQTHISRVNVHVPDPLSIPCPNAAGGFNFERGISDNPDDRHGTEESVDLWFTRSSDGDCRTLDGDLQDLRGRLSHVRDGAEVPICVTFQFGEGLIQTCTEVKVQR